MLEFAEWLAGTGLSLSIQTALWAIPTLQSIHILAIAVVLSSVFMIDLRILNVTGRSQTMTQTARRFLPWLWLGLVVLAASGILLIVGEPVRSLLNRSFWIKMALLALAVAATLAFQATLRRDMALWETVPARRRATQVLAALSFLVWCAIIVFGRWIAYTEVPY